MTLEGIMELTAKDLDVINRIEIENGFLDIEYEEEFQNLLDEDKITAEWVNENAIWMQLEDESDESYDMFKKYCALPIDKWDAKHLPQYKSSLVQSYIDSHYWKQRRLLYLKYKDWFDKRKSELEHLEAISLYRDNQAKVLRSTSKSSLLLIEKLQQRIESIDADEIDPRNIPQFISAVSTFVSLAADAEARALAVDSLLGLHAEELSSLNLGKHMAVMTEERTKTSDSVKETKAKPKVKKK